MTTQIQFTKASKKKAKLRLGIMGASGSGKTLGALKVAKGIASSMDKVFVIDTEHGSADLYSDARHGLAGYNTFTMSAPFAPLRYVEAINAAHQAGAEVIIVDSASHAWEGEGGSLDQVDKKGGNGFTAWKEVTPQHRTMVEALLQIDSHIICTLRSKQEYVLEEQVNRNGKTVQVPVRKGMAPIMRAGFEYEMTVFIDVREDHHAQATKDRTSTLDGKLFQLSEQVGADLKRWLDSGEQAPAVQAPVFVQPPAPAYHPDTNDGPAPAQAPQAGHSQGPMNLTDAVKAMSALSNRITNMKTKAEGAALWTEVEAAGPVIGPQAVASLKQDMIQKSKTLSAQETAP